MGEIETTGSVGHSHQEECAHPVTSSTVTAGMRRRVCEECGHVSVQFVAETVRLFPESNVEIDLTPGQSTPMRRQPRRCFVCKGRALYITPKGLACTAHAWEAAAEQEAMGRDLWIPIRIVL